MLEQIIIENMTKKYNGRMILDGVNVSFCAGDSVAFIGHNGSGKSTFLKIAAGLVAPTSGKVIVHRPVLFHYVPEKFMPLPLTARGYLKRMGRLDGLSSDEAGQQIEALGNDFFLGELLDVPLKYLSKGSLQKISVIQALLKKPEVLLLDEPLSGQDEASQEIFLQKVNALRNQGVTVLMSCHEQRLVDAIAQKTYLIRDGKLVPWQQRIERTCILILDNVKKRPLFEGMEQFGNNYRLQVKEGAVQQVVLELLQNGWELRRMYDEKNY